MDSSHEPALKFLHSESTLNQSKLNQFRRLPTDVLKRSLEPGQQGSLKVRPDGTVLDGHHRILILMERREDVQGLPRETIEREV